MKKKFLVGLLAVVMCFALVGCGKTESNNGGSNNGGSNNGGSSTSSTSLSDADKDNYASMLKEKFGIDAKEIEEDGFSILSVSGSEYNGNLKLTLTYSTKDNDTAAFQDAYKEKFFNVTKKAGGSNYKADDNGYISSTTVSNYSDLGQKSYDVGDWYYKYSGIQVHVNITAGSSVWIQLTGSPE